MSWGLVSKYEGFATPSLGLSKRVRDASRRSVGTSMGDIHWFVGVAWALVKAPILLFEEIALHLVGGLTGQLKGTCVGRLLTNYPFLPRSGHFRPSLLQIKKCIIIFLTHAIYTGYMTAIFHLPLAHLNFRSIRGHNSPRWRPLHL